MRRGVSGGAGAALALLFLLSSGCTALGSDKDALQRGDEAFAREDYAEALAEYRLAVRQGADDATTHLRVAHAYARMGRLTEAREHYEEALERDGSLLDQAVSGLVQAARDANGQGNAIGAATAIELALRLRPGIAVGDLALPLARHFSRQGQYGEALPFYQKALAENIGDPEVVPDLLFELASTYDELGDCQRALLYFEHIREEAGPERRERIDWYIGRCSYELAREARDEEDEDEAIRRLEMMIEIGEPRNLLAQAYFDMGEVLVIAGACTRAVDAFEAAQRPEHNPPTVLVQRAREQVDEIRFGRGCPPPPSSES